MAIIKIVPFPGPKGEPGDGIGDITFSGVKIIGAGTASGDDLGNSTIEIVPDNDLYNNDQYLIIDPTAPNHIHIRAGGTQDAANAVLILGGEQTNVSVMDYAKQVSIQTYNIESENSYYWYFGNDGTFYGPAMGSVIVPGLSSPVDNNLNLYSTQDIFVSTGNQEIAGIPVGFRYPVPLDLSEETSPINAQLSHMGRLLWHDEAETTKTYVVPLDATLNFPAGTEIKFACGSASDLHFTSEDNDTITFVGEGGSNYFYTLSGSNYFILPANRTATLTKLAADRWQLSGFGVTD